MKIKRKEYGYNTWGFSLKSEGEDNPNLMLLWLGSIVYTIYFKHFIFKPYLYKWKHEGHVYDMIASKELSFTVHTGSEDGFISFNYGADEDSLMSDDGGKNIKDIPRVKKIWSIPWRQYTFRKHILSNIDGTDFVTLTENTDKKVVDVYHDSWDYPGHERIKFTFFDGFDDSIITATAYREKRVWTRGSSWMSWLKYFTKPIVRDVMSFSFDKEVGSGKESWKGGIVGHSIDIEGREGPLGACMRYCKENGHLFLNFERDENGKMIYKNVPTQNESSEAVERAKEK